MKEVNKSIKLINEKFNEVEKIEKKEILELKNDMKTLSQK